jgi:putative transposase
MALRHRQSIAGKAIFFVTTSRINHLEFPNYPESLNVIQEIIFRTAPDKTISLMGYIIMPNHLHLIIKTQNGGKDLSRYMHSIKGRIRESLIGKGRFWEERFDDFMIRNEEQFAVKLNYIHYNPVRAGLVKEPGEWKYSSYLDWIKRISEKGIVFDFD